MSGNPIPVSVRKTAERWLDRDPLFLDTETTGMGQEDEVISVALCDAEGNALMDTLVRPACAWIAPASMAIHGLTEEELRNAPGWPEVAGVLRRLLEGRPVVIFCAPFDIRMMKQSCKAYGLDWWWVVGLDTRCAMKLAEKAFGEGIGLRKALGRLGVPFGGTEHRALDDARATARLLKALAESETFI